MVKRARLHHPSRRHRATNDLSAIRFARIPSTASPPLAQGCADAAEHREVRELPLPRERVSYVIRDEERVGEGWLAEGGHCYVRWVECKRSCS
jgi:hypothetical protein